MSNQLNQNPIIVTAAMANTWKQSVAATLGAFYYLRIKKIYWLNPLNSGDTVFMVDAAGVNIWSARCESANQSQLFDWTASPLRVSDFQISSISSGTLEIYIE